MTIAVQQSLVTVVRIKSLHQHGDFGRKPTERLVCTFVKHVEAIVHTVARLVLIIKGVAGVEHDFLVPMPEVLRPHLCPEVTLRRFVVTVAPVGLQRSALVVVVDEMVEAVLPLVVVGKVAVHRHAVLRKRNLEETPEGQAAVRRAAVAHGLLSVAADEVAHGGSPIRREEAVEHGGIIASRTHAECSVQEVIVVIALLVVESGGETEGVVRLLEVEFQVVLCAYGEVAAVRAA